MSSAAETRDPGVTGADCDRCFVVVLTTGSMVGSDSECLGACRCCWAAAAAEEEEDATAFVSLLMDAGKGGTGGTGGEDDECLEIEDFCEVEVWFENQSLYDEEEDEDVGEVGSDGLASSLYVGGKLMGCSLNGARGQLPERRSTES